MTIRRGAALLLLGGALMCHPSDTPAATRCHEDQPCWNWVTMGNHLRGVYDYHGNELVVSPCRFQRLMKAHVIDYWPTDVYKGDALAMRLDCHGLAVQSY